MVVDCVSDLHGHYPKLEGGDLLIVAGDLTKNDASQEHVLFLQWLRAQHYKKRILIAGNHDSYLQKGMEGMVGTSGMFETDKIDVFLCDSGIEFEYDQPVNFIFDPDNKSFVFRKKIKIWGSPWSLKFDGMNPHCTAFTGIEEELEAKFRLIPDDVDILITHGPPYGILDEVESQVHCTSFHAGSKSLRKRIDQLKITHHFFGHIHEGYGSFHTGDGVLCVNASHVNQWYEPVNPPIRIIL